jgi:prepilin-type N-terminal cleavage/methylation domain-containing protein
MPRTRALRTAGFSATEMLLVITVLGIVASMAVFQIEAARPGIRGDGAMRALMTQLTTARELAMSERRNIEIAFPASNQVSIIRHEVPAGTTTLRTVALEGGVEFRLIPGVGDTPEAFGNGAAVDFDGAGVVMFSTDGSLIDATGKRGEWHRIHTIAARSRRSTSTARRTARTSAATPSTARRRGSTRSIRTSWIRRSCHHSRRHSAI